MKVVTRFYVVQYRESPADQWKSTYRCPNQKLAQQNLIDAIFEAPHCAWRLMWEDSVFSPVSTTASVKEGT